MDFQNSFTATKSKKFSTKPMSAYPSHLNYVAALPCETVKFEKSASSGANIP